MNQHPTIQRFTALLITLVFLAASMVHSWHHCCGDRHLEGCHTSGVGMVADAVNTVHTAPFDDTESPLHACCQSKDHREDQTLLRMEHGVDCVNCLTPWTNDKAVLHHHHHACCEHNLSPAIDDAITKSPVKLLTINLLQFPLALSILPKTTQPTPAHYPPSTLQRTGRQLLASLCVLRC